MTLPPRPPKTVTVTQHRGSLDPSLRADAQEDPTRGNSEASDPQTQFDVRPLETRQQILARARADAEARKRAKEDAEGEQRARVVATNDPNFLAAVHALEGNVVVPSGEGDGSVRILETEHTRPDAVLRGTPLSMQQGITRPAPSFGPGAVADISADGYEARIRKPQPQANSQGPTPETGDPLAALHAMPFAPHPLQTETPGQPAPVIPGGGLIGRAQARLKVIDQPVQNWGFYKFLKTSEAHATAAIPIVLPSNGVFYPAQVSVGVFTLEDLWLVAEAHETKNITPLIAAMARVVTGCDVRELTVDDFYYLMHIVRLRSYPRTPWVFYWTSKYGNASSFTVTEATLPCIVLDATPQEFEAQWGSQGIDPPRVKHWEAINGEPLTDADKDLWARAQYLYGETIEERVAHALARGLPALEVVRDYRESKFDNYGVKLTYTVRDPNFNGAVWLSALQKQYDDGKVYRTALALEAGEDAETVMMLDAGLAQLALQIQETKAKLAAGTLIADEEEVRADVDALTFFPQL